MNILFIIIRIILFLIFISIVVCIHELGHLIVAKICNVYCFDFSIGFGPSFFSKKFKHKVKKNKKQPLYSALTNDLKVEGETSFSLRIFPFGGFVAMAGEDDPEQDIKIPENRTLNGVNHFKQIAIMLAGITMNFILTLVLFFAAFQFTPQYDYHADSNQITVVDNSLASQAGIKSGDKITSIVQTYSKLIYFDESNISSEVEDIIYPATENQVELKYYTDDKNNLSITDYNKLGYDSIAKAILNVPYYNATTSTDKIVLSSKYKNLSIGKDSTRTIKVTYLDSNNNLVEYTTPKMTSIATKDNGYTFDTFGITVFYTTYMNNFSQAISKTGITFHKSFVGTYQALGSLFTPQGWKNVGGIVAVYKISSQGFESGSAYTILMLWGFISLNLGCFNLLPFPGLDGWQALIALIETISRKKIKSRVKNGFNTVGLIIMIVLMVLLIVKDIMFPVV